MKRINPPLRPAACTGAALVLFCVAAGAVRAQGPSATPIGLRLELFEDSTLGALAQAAHSSVAAIYIGSRCELFADHAMIEQLKVKTGLRLQIS